MARELRPDGTAQKALDYLAETGALDLGESGWGTYEDDESVSPFDFDTFFGDSRGEGWHPDLPDDFLGEIEEALYGKQDSLQDQVGFPNPRDKQGTGVSWDTCAWYQPLHFFGSDWGIFMREECLLKYAIAIARRTDRMAYQSEKAAARAAQGAGNQLPPYWRFSDAEIFLRAAIICLYLHEHFHHKVECLGLRLHVVTRMPLYVPYFKNVYQATLGTDDLLEEGLANASMYLRLAEQTYKKLLPESVRDGLRRELKTSFPYDPPGYRTASNYLDQFRFNAGENLLQGFVRETTQRPVQPHWHWENAPRMTQSFLNIKSNIYTVVPIGNRPILSRHAMPLSCSTGQLIEVCKRHGFEISPKQGKGNHTVMSKPGIPNIVTIPKRKDLSIGVIKNTLATLGGYRVAELPKLLKS